MVVREQVKQIASVTPYLFEDHIIISLSKEWLIAFGKIPTFDAFVVDKRLQLISKEKIQEIKDT